MNILDTPLHRPYENKCNAFGTLVTPDLSQSLYPGFWKLSSITDKAEGCQLIEEGNLLRERSGVHRVGRADVDGVLVK